MMAARLEAPQAALQPGPYGSIADLSPLNTTFPIEEPPENWVITIPAQVGVGKEFGLPLGKYVFFMTIGLRDESGHYIYDSFASLSLEQGMTSDIGLSCDMLNPKPGSYNLEAFLAFTSPDGRQMPLSQQYCQFTLVAKGA
jgi:hypothetical protein